MLTYALKSAVFLSAFYIPYMLLLRKESFYRFNRLMLLTILLLSLLLPLCDVHVLAWRSAEETGPLNVLMAPGTLYAPGTSNMPDAPGVSTTPTPVAPFDWLGLLPLLYWIGLAVVLLIKLIQLLRLHRQIHQGVLWTDCQDGVTIYCHAGNVPSFSWMHSVVISEADYCDHAAEILQHELGHIRHHHSLDILLVNLVEIVQWFNPLIWLLAASLRDIHEYEADACVLQSGLNIRQYQTLLIKKAVGSSSYAFANSFNHSLLKKRFTMMLQKKSNPWMRSKALYVIPVAVLALSAFATPSPTTPSVAPEGNMVENRGKATTFSAEMQTPVKKKSASAPQKTTTAHPAVKAGTLITGTVTDEKGVPVAQAKVVERNKAKQVVATVVTDIDGKFSFKAHGTGHIMSVSAQGYKRDVAYNLNKTTYTVRMGHFDQPVAATPAKTAATATSAPAPQDRFSAPASESDEVFEIVEHLPLFPGGTEALMKYMMQNLKYPQAAIDMAFEGRLIVQFVVRKDGSLGDFKILRGSEEIIAAAVKRAEQESGHALTEAEKKPLADAAKSLDDEALRVIRAMPRWQPALQRGKRVNSRFTLPVTFRLK
jgi:outer membrane biosynthesis protein TonB